MASRGFLIRFIDIGLIVLFGFLMISDIEATSRVELAGGAASVDESLADQPEDRAYLIVEITPDGAFRVTDMGRGSEDEDEAGGVSPETAGQDETAEATTLVVDDVESLAEVLSAGRSDHRAADLQTVVLIQPHLSSVVQHTVDVMDVCDRLSLPKSLRMDIRVAEAAPGAEPS